MDDSLGKVGSLSRPGSAARSVLVVEFAQPVALGALRAWLATATFYLEILAAQHQLPCIMSETGSATHPSLATGATSQGNFSSVWSVDGRVGLRHGRASPGKALLSNSMLDRGSLPSRCQR
jgi:hypothetical protein